MFNVYVVLEFSCALSRDVFQFYLGLHAAMGVTMSIYVHIKGVLKFPPHLIF